MKKLLLLVMVIGAALSIQAQSAVTMPLAVGDTIVNTGTSAKVIGITGGFSGVAVQVDLTKISGTGAGTVQLQGSNTNTATSFVNIGSAFTITNIAAQTAMFYVAAPLPRYIKVLSTGSGTESVVQTITYRLPKYQNN